MNNHDTEDPATIAPTRRLNFSGPAAEASKAAESVPALPEPMIFSTPPSSGAAEKVTAETSATGHRLGADDMTVEELRRQQEEIDRKIHERQETERKAVIEQIVNVVHSYHIPVEELVDALGGLKRKGVKAVQKYQDPATGATWSGRGKEPAWIRGKDRKLFQIT